MKLETIGNTRTHMDLKATSNSLKGEKISVKFSDKLSSFSNSSERVVLEGRNSKDTLQVDSRNNSKANKSNEFKNDLTSDADEKINNEANKEKAKETENTKDKLDEKVKDTKEITEANQEEAAIIEESIVNDITDENLEAIAGMVNVNQEVSLENTEEIKGSEVKITPQEVDLEQKEFIDIDLVDTVVEGEDKKKNEEDFKEITPKTTIADEATTRLKDGHAEISNKEIPEKSVRQVIRTAEENPLEEKLDKVLNNQVKDEPKPLINLQNTGDARDLKREFNTPSEDRGTSLTAKEDIQAPINQGLFNRGDVRSFEEVVVEKFGKESQTVDKMLKDISYELNSSKQQMKIKLQPRELGDMTLDMKMVKGELVAKIVVDNEKAKVMIEQNLINLRETLRKQNIEIKTVEVQVGNNEDYEMHEQNMEGQSNAGQGQRQGSNMRNNKFGYNFEAFEEFSAKAEEILTEGFDISV